LVGLEGKGSKELNRLGNVAVFIKTSVNLSDLVFGRLIVFGLKCKEYYLVSRTVSNKQSVAGSQGVQNWPEIILEPR
jgi:hypothetical protein